MNYTLPCTREEYDSLREKREELIRKNRDGFNDAWKPRVKGIEVTFRYNPSRAVLGIFVKNNGKYELADSESQAKTKPQTIAKSVISNGLLEIIKEELYKIKLKNSDEWID